MLSSLVWERPSCRWSSDRAGAGDRQPATAPVADLLVRRSAEVWITHPARYCSRASEAFAASGWLSSPARIASYASQPRACSAPKCWLQRRPERSGSELIPFGVIPTASIGGCRRCAGRNLLPLMSVW